MKQILNILKRARVAHQKGRQVRVLANLKSNDRVNTLTLLRREGLDYSQVSEDYFVLYFGNELPVNCLQSLEKATQAHWMVCRSSVAKKDLGHFDSKFNKHRKFEKILQQAFNLKASDIFLTLTSEGVLLQFRQKRCLLSPFKLNGEEGEALLKSLLALAQLNFDDTLRTREGHFRYLLDGKIVFCRLSYVASSVSQSLVLRLLSEDLFPFILGNLQLPNDLLNCLKNSCRNWHSGMILISGPTGSGKTTTLYSLAKLLRQYGQKVLSIEDPIEAELSELLQTEIAPKIGYTFEEALRAVLRQDPNVILLGEIRDAETAKAAFYASLSGYLVITTLHAQNLSMVPLRCLELGIDFSVFQDNVRLQIHQQWEDNNAGGAPRFQWKVKEESS